MGAYSAKPRTRMADLVAPLNLERDVPKAFGDWMALPDGGLAIVNPETKALLSSLYDQTLSRTYVNELTGQSVMLSIAYGADQGDAKRLHFPEVCYPAQGFQVRSIGLVPIQIGERKVQARRLVAKRGSRVESIAYWTMVGESPVTGGANIKLAQLHYGFRGIIPDGLIFRVSMLDPLVDAELGPLGEFASAIASSLDRQVASRLFGSLSLPSRVTQARGILRIAGPSPHLSKAT